MRNVLIGCFVIGALALAAASLQTAQSGGDARLGAVGAAMMLVAALSLIEAQ